MKSTPDDSDVGGPGPHFQKVKAVSSDLRPSGLAGWEENSPSESQSSWSGPLVARKASWTERGPHKRGKQDAPRRKGTAAHLWPQMVKS